MNNINFKIKKYFGKVRKDQEAKESGFERPLQSLNNRKRPFSKEEP